LILQTGTLTEDGLDLWGVIPKHEGHFDHPQREPSLLLPESPLIVAMAVCHSLTLLEGKLTGDPLDLRMFEATRWVSNVQI
jgi:magnesium-transporting ATPase (P-type)